MEKLPEAKHREGAVTKIKPISFRSRGPARSKEYRKALNWLAGCCVGCLILGLVGTAWFVFTARQVSIEILPKPDHISITGGVAAPRIGNYRLMRPGTYTLSAAKACYDPLTIPLSVTGEKKQNFKAAMERQSGKLLLDIRQEGSGGPIQNTRVSIDNAEAIAVSGDAFDVIAGRHNVKISADNYKDFQAELEIQGCGQLQTLPVSMIPNWSDITISSIPTGAAIRVDGNLAGETPRTLALPAGVHDLELSIHRYKTRHISLTVVANQAQELKDIRLQPADGKLVVKSTPAGATIMAGSRYVGTTPATVMLPSGAEQVMRISKAGYETAVRRLTIKPAMQKTLAVSLEPLRGVVRFRVKPADAELAIDGESRGRVPESLSLIAADHDITISRKGYFPHTMQITPRPGFPIEIRIALKGEASKASMTSEMLSTSDGYTLKLIRPQAYTMGSSRREQGRRPNETLRRINFSRPFYMGIGEVSNRLFRKFQAEHRSGSEGGQDLNDPSQPVVRVTWEEAALFCNWLSARESLPPVYVKKRDQLVAATPMGIGYRLPTEAEWEYCARFHDGQAVLKYPWGNTFPPGAKSGNFADESARDLLPSYIKGYNDNYAVTAPSGQFAANALGLIDIGGNVAEWCHDFYTIYSYRADKIYVEPAGPVDGRHHVVRGSGWKHASISTLRSAYRDYSDSKRPDLGFRICRYAK